MANDTLLNPGTAGDTIRTLQKGTPKTQAVAIDQGGSGAEAFWTAQATVTNPGDSAPPVRLVQTSRAGTGGPLNALNAAVTVDVDGMAGVGVFIGVTTLAGTIIFEVSADGGTSWNQVEATADGLSADYTFVNPVAGTHFEVQIPTGARKLRVRVSAFTNGSGLATAIASATISARALERLPSYATGTLAGSGQTVSFTLSGQRRVAVSLVGALSFNGKVSLDFMSLNGEWETRYFHSGDGLVAEDKLPPGTGANRRNYNIPTLPSDLIVRIRVTQYNSGSMTAWIRGSNTSGWLLTTPVPQPYRTLDTTIGALNAAIICVPMGAEVGFVIIAGTFAGTLGVDGTNDDGTSWNMSNLPFRDLTNDMTRTGLVFANPNPFTLISVPVPNGCTYIRLTAKAWTSGNFVAFAASRPDASTVRVASGVADTPASGALGALNAAVTVPCQGQVSIGFAIDAGTLAGSVVVETSPDGGVTWFGAMFNDGSRWRVSAAPMVFTNPNAATQIDAVVTSAATHARLKVSAYTSGTANARARASQLSSAIALAIATGISGNATPYFATRMAGDNGANLQAVWALLAPPADAASGLVTRPIPRQLVTYDAPFRLADATAGQLSLTFTFTANTNKQLATIYHAASATKTVRIRKISIFLALGAAGTYNFEVRALSATTAPATGNPAITPRLHNAGNGAVEATCLALPTTAGSLVGADTGTVGLPVEWLSGAGAGPTSPAGVAGSEIVLFEANATKEIEPLVMRAGVAEGFTINGRCTAAVALRFTALIQFTEE